MKKPRTDTSRKSKEFAPPSGFQWMVNDFLPSIGGLYDELAKVNILPRVSRRGRPRQDRHTIPLWAAIERDQQKRPMLEVGALIKMWQTEGRLGDSEAAIGKARRSSPATKADLKRLARRHVKEGRVVLADQESEEDWPPKPDGKHHAPAPILRMQLQDTVMRAVARWLAKDARSYCNPSSPYYEIFADVLNKDKITHDIVWLFGRYE